MSNLRAWQRVLYRRAAGHASNPNEPSALGNEPCDCPPRPPRPPLRTHHELLMGEAFDEEVSLPRADVSVSGDSHIGQGLGVSTCRRPFCCGVM